LTGALPHTLLREFTALPQTLQLDLGEPTREEGGEKREEKGRIGEGRKREWIGGIEGGGRRGEKRDGRKCRVTPPTFGNLNTGFL